MLGKSRIEEHLISLQKLWEHSIITIHIVNQIQMILCKYSEFDQCFDMHLIFLFHNSNECV